MGFWIIAHLLHNSDLYASVNEEIQAAILGDDRLDMNVLLTKCPHLDAVWHETLRIYNAASVVRRAERDCMIGDKSIHKETTVLAPFRQFHLNPNIFGRDAGGFNPERFLKNKGLQRVKGYAPFGGGHTYCPGRLFAQQEIYMFIALTLHRFEITISSQQALKGIPSVDLKRPSPAAMGPASDILVDLRLREPKN